MKLTTLDCTLRDGGYYNNWCFDSELVDAYLLAMSSAGIDYVELGLRNFPKQGFLGAFAYTTEKYLNSLTTPANLKLGVMVDAKTIIDQGTDLVGAVNHLFIEKSQSKICLVRVAAHFHEIDQCLDIVKTLKDLGYIVGLNLMQAGGKANDILKEKARQIKSWNLVDVLYFADSLGNMDEAEVLRIIAALTSEWDGPVGIHTHNNQGKAISNSISSMNNGVSWIDSTMLGMGRGAGNAQTEILLTELNKVELNRHNLDLLYKVALDQFEPLKTQYNWGQNLFYHFSAMYNIHPSYAQDLLSDNRYSSEEKVAAIKYLASKNSTSYNTKNMSQAFGLLDADSALFKRWSAKDCFANADILLLGAGKSLAKYANQIEDLIKNSSLVVLSINIHNEIDKALIDGVVSVDRHRMLLELNQLVQLNKPIYSPTRNHDEIINEALKNSEVHDFDMRIDENDIYINENGCQIPACLSVVYALALAKAGGAKRVFLVGFDGYAGDDQRQQDMTNALKKIEQVLTGLEIISLTPTTYPIKQGSLYAPYN